MNTATGIALERFLAAVNAAGESVRHQSGDYRTRCLAHNGTDPNLSISQGDRGVVLTCHSHQCPVEDIAAAYGLAQQDLFDDAGDSEKYRQRKAELWMPCQLTHDRDRKPLPNPCTGHKVAEFPYHDEAGELLYAEAKCSRKREGCKNPFAQWRPDSSKRSGKSWSLRGVRLVPYRLPELIAAVKEGATVYIVEGPGDAERLRSMGLAATSSPLGAGKWRAEYARYFLGAKVVVIADRDDPGFGHAADVYRSLAGVAASIEVLMAAVNRKGADVSDHLDAGFSVADLVPAVREDPVELVDPIPTVGDSPLDGVLDPEVEDLFAAPAKVKAAPVELSVAVESGPLAELEATKAAPVFELPTVSVPEVPDQRTAMSDVHVEQSVLGSMLYNPRLIEGAVDQLSGADFTIPAHEAIFTTLMGMYAANTPVDPNTVADAMARGGVYQAIGRNRDYLTQLNGFHIDVELMREHVRILKERSSKRQIEQILVQAMSRNGSDQWTSADLAESVSVALQSVVSQQSQQELLSVKDRLPGYIEQRVDNEEVLGLISPWGELNEVVAFTPKRVLTVGAGTGVGKSLVAAQWAACTALEYGLPTLVVSMEMSAYEIMDRFVSNLGRINLSRLSNADLKGEKFAKFKRSQGEPAGALTDLTPQFMKTVSIMEEADHLWVCDDGSVTLSKIRAMVRSMAARGMKPALLVVDYIQLIDTEQQKGLSEVQALTKVSRGLKTIAMDFDLCLLSVAQFNRDTKGREPGVQDFKGSSAIEQDSDIILILHSDLDEETGKILDKSEIQMIVAKNRNGSNDRRIKLIGQQHYAQFVEARRAGQGV